MRCAQTSRFGNRRSSRRTADGCAAQGGSEGCERGRGSGAHRPAPGAAVTSRRGAVGGSSGEACHSASPPTAPLPSRRVATSRGQCRWFLWRRSVYPPHPRPPARPPARPQALPLRRRGSARRRAPPTSPRPAAPLPRRPPRPRPAASPRTERSDARRRRRASPRRHACPHLASRALCGGAERVSLAQTEQRPRQRSLLRPSVARASLLRPSALAPPTQSAVAPRLNQHPSRGHAGPCGVCDTVCE